MSTTGVEVFDTTIQKTNGWLKDVMQALTWHDKHKAYQALRATLHALRDRLTGEEVAQLGAQLPMLIRGFYYEGWNPTGKPARIRHKKEFLARVDYEFRGDASIDPEQVTCAVFSVLSQRVADGEIEDVKRLLPADILEFWP